MGVAFSLVLLPLIPAGILCVLKKYFFQKWVTVLFAILIAVLSILFAVKYMHFSEGKLITLTYSSFFDDLVLVGDFLIASAFIYICTKLSLKMIWVSLLVILQYGALLFCEFTGKFPAVTHHFYFDGLSSVMALVIGVVGAFISIYSIGYMKHFHEKNPEIKDRSNLFIAAIFLFFFAMFGIIFSNSLTWIYFFWEITTLCSFIMISYSKTDEAIRNAFRAVWMLLLGGLGFVIAIIYSAHYLGTVELHKLVHMNKFLVMLPILFLCFAGMTKAALYPFGDWLLGAMVAPTPSSALLHSSTMVKAGVYLILRCSPVLHNTPAGMVVAAIGGFSFLAGSAIAISQRDGKKILAYSTIANLGLIVLCAGVGSGFALWAATLVIIFHAVAKALMFLCTGTIAQQISSKNVEDMNGLICYMPATACATLIGLSGMFLAPFGLLISKWAVIEALAVRSPIFPPIVIFGGSMMLFFWVKWMGKILVIISDKKSKERGVGFMEWVGLFGLSFMTILASAGYPFIGKYWLEPIYGINPMIRQNVGLSISIMLALMLLPLFFFLIRRKQVVLVGPYLSGLNADGRGGVNDIGPEINNNLVGNADCSKEWRFSNYYLDKFFGERRLYKGVMAGSISLLVLMFFISTF